MKQVKHLLEVTYMWKNPQVDSKWFSPNRSCLALSYGGNFPGPLSQSSCSCAYVVWLRALSNVHAHLSAKMNFLVWGFLGGWQDMLWAGTTPPSSFDLWGSFLLTCDLGCLLDHKNEKKCDQLIFYSSRAQLSVVLKCRGKLFRATQPGAHLSPASIPSLKVCVMGGGGHMYVLTLTCVDLSAERMSGERVCCL